MLKIAGMILITASGASFGIMQAQRLIKRVDFFEDYISLITEIQNLISYNALPLDEIIFSIHSGDTIKPFVDVLKAYIEHGKSFHSAWIKSVDVFNPYNCLNDDDKKLLYSFGRGLGITDIAGQVAHCSLSLSIASERLNRYRSEKANKVKLFRTLGTLAGAACALLII